MTDVTSVTQVKQVSDEIISHSLQGWPKVVFGWSDLEKKKRERKEIGRKRVYFSYLIGRKIGMEKLNNAQI